LTVPINSPVAYRKNLSIKCSKTIDNAGNPVIIRSEHGAGAGKEHIREKEVKQVTRWLICNERSRTVFVNCERIVSVSAEVYPSKEGYVGKVVIRLVDGSLAFWWSSKPLPNHGDALTQAEGKAREVIRFLAGVEYQPKGEGVITG